MGSSHFCISLSIAAMHAAPKLDLPSDEARRLVASASELALAGDLKAGHAVLKEAIAKGVLTSATQRQVVARWSSGNYDVPGLKVEQKVEPAQAPADKVEKKEESYEEQVVRVMRRDAYSRKKAEECIEEGGLEMEQVKDEMDHPLDDTFKKMLANGPPQWFVDMVNNGEATELEEAANAALGTPIAPPAVLGSA